MIWLNTKSQSQRVRAAIAWAVLGAPILGLGLLGTTSTMVPAGLRPPPPQVPHCIEPTLCPWALLTTRMTRPKEPSRGDPERHRCQHSHPRPPQPPGDCAQRAASPGLLQEGPAACAPPLWLHWPSGVPVTFASVTLTGDPSRRRTREQGAQPHPHCPASI